MLFRSKGYNNAAELLADTNTFNGIDIVRFRVNINIILDRETFEHISLLEQFEKTMNLYRKYYQYEEIKGTLRETVKNVPVEVLERRSPMRLYTEHGCECAYPCGHVC